ncbi:ABC transporter permease [Dysgonomonas sp. HDW5A]|uniref:ABC transporter permease n=1 Tax=Dysgonomonas sp. HDW5A TaxID=2714926 RepID=UPI00140AE276|nr:ABC transporter permease [Dysgonomonas sp. HDW5A]QIK59497.1 ABC transporter permease [Dysgonomonas sp. HDW5A]
MKLIWKLLRENISKPQLIGFAVASLIGMSIVLLAFQFYFDINPLFTGKDKLLKEDYLTITKKVGILGGLSSRSNGFSQNEIDDLKKQSFVKNVGAFTPSQFNVFGGFNSQKLGIAFNTEMFFESVPDQFIDVTSDNWRFSPVDNTVPIILPKNYLDLYNFGFAQASSMPRISEQLIGLINLDISITGKNGLRQQMKGRIVGFSNRINSILVPETFMTWANQQYGGTPSEPARLIIEVSNIADPNLSGYFKDKGFEISGDNTTASKMSFFLKIIIGIVVSVGVLICVLSFFILVLSIYLLLEKNMNKLRTLRLIGYSKSIVVKPYEWLAVGLNLVILALSLAITFVVRAQYLHFIGKLLPLAEARFSVYTLLIGITIFVLLSLLNILIIRRKVK